MTEYEVRLNNSKVSTMVEDISPEFAIIKVMYRRSLTDIASAVVYVDGTIVYQCGQCTLKDGHLSIKD